ncbi:ATP-binding protein [Pseudenhygromyxa sp. WMMC2535]|uniref:AAA family ATPase n=1 Tax=Pseudenhygromyxa sp. WMMC2535 TaxID=2712867 RepID=UPI0015573FAA|nr:ATP-binding protein [Pseudenhygromyxa sp. WMMC2535]NVB40634.1 ATP-binding protein [Pseudenhygromyxa sp. WMMC2535]
MRTTPGTLHLLIGPVGAGKSTYARRRALETGALFFDLDAWMVRLYGADERPAEGTLDWYLERRERCRGLLWDTTCDALGCGVDVFLELGLIGRGEREDCYRRARAEDLELRVLLLDAPRDLRRERVLARNDAPGPFTQIVPPAFFERATDAWEPPSADERDAWEIVSL